MNSKTYRIQGTNRCLHTKFKTILLIIRIQGISKSVQELTKHLKVIGQRNVVNVIGVPGYKWYAGNQKSDFLAKQGTKNLLTTRCNVEYHFNL